MPKKSSKEKQRTKKQIALSSLPETKLNVIIALLLVLIGKTGEKELLKKRRADSNIVRYLSRLGLRNKDLASILNTTESGISNLKAKKK